ncbi:MAG: hypothetical protein H0W21_07130 [Actinobacteria bacterium]|nr:hypothetical protein [Actinomycetota bacterium]
MQEAFPTEVSGSPDNLLDQVRILLRFSDPSTAGVWPRAAALLARQALESGLGELWQRRAPSVEHCSLRAQLLCLRSYIDGDTAERAAHTWGVLSRACHHHPYELGPTAGELRSWVEDTQRVVDACKDG